MKTKTIRGEELIKALETAIPNCKIITKDGNLHRLDIGEIAIVVGSYSVEVTKIELPIVYKVEFELGGVKFTHEFNSKEEADLYSTKIGNDVKIEIKEETKDIPF